MLRIILYFRVGHDLKLIESLNGRNLYLPSQVVSSTRKSKLGIHPILIPSRDGHGRRIVGGRHPLVQESPIDVHVHGIHVQVCICVCICICRRHERIGSVRSMTRTRGGTDGSVF